MTFRFVQFLPYGGDSILIVEVHGEQLMVKSSGVNSILHILAKVEYSEENLKQNKNNNCIDPEPSSFKIDQVELT